VVYALPAMVLICAFLGYPLARVLTYSLTRWDGIGTPEWVGVRNFSQLVHDEVFLDALKNNAIYALSVPVEVVGALVVAYLIHGRIPGWRLFRSTFFLPAIYSTVVVGVIAGIGLQSNGLLDNALRASGLHFLAKDWLARPGTARLWIVIIVVWANVGYSMLIYLAGMSSVDPNLAEAARVDGAGPWRILFRIYVPSLRRVLELVLVINTITAFANMFTYIYVITNGGPGFSTYSAEFFVYNKAFTFGALGYASAAGVVLTLLIAVLGFFQIRSLSGSRS
jgi:multiple sugar transport system permease protein